MRKRKQRREVEFKKQLKMRAARRKRRPVPMDDRLALVTEYYLPAFYDFGRALAERGYTRNPSHHRADFWRTIPPNVYQPPQALELLERYLVYLDAILKSTIEQHSIAYWLHVCRRFAPLPIGTNKDPETILWTRASLDAAIQKYGRLEPCDGIDDSGQIDDAAVLRGYLKEHHPTALEALRESPQLVLTNFGIAEYEQTLELEKIAYEIWRSMAHLRTVGKGAPLRVSDEELWFYDERGDDLDFLLTNFDGRELPFTTTATGTVFESGFEAGPKGLVLLPQWNARNLEFKDLRDLLKLFTKIDIVTPSGGPNFIWIPFNITAFYEAHRFFSDAFRERYGLSLESVLGIVGTLSSYVLLASKESPISFLRMWQRAYEPPGSASELKQWLAESMPGTLRTFDVPIDAALQDLDAAFDFLTLTEKRRHDIDLGYAGPHSPLLPFGGDRVFIDYAYLFQRLYYLFLRVEVPDQNFKGAALEAITHRGKSALPIGQLHAHDGTSRQIDAAFALDDLLVIAECRAVAKSIAVLRGNPTALAKRQEVIDKALKDIDEKAQWLRDHPKGSNYDVSAFRYILPVGVTPFVEFIHSRNPNYWIDERLPRVLSPHELEEALASVSIAKIAQKCSNTVRLS